MHCPKCRGLVGREVVTTEEGKCSNLYCINCGWRPTRASQRRLKAEARERKRVLTVT